MTLRLTVILLSALAGASAHADSEQITERLRPSELANRREVQVAFTAAPHLMFSMGPFVNVSGKTQLQNGLFFGGEFGLGLESSQVQTLMGEVGYSFFRKKGGPSLAALVGVSHQYGSGNFMDNQNGFHWAAKLRLGWDFMLGNVVSLGISVAGAYYSRAYLNSQDQDKDGMRVPLEVAIPLRIWL